MNTKDLSEPVTFLLSELVDGSSPDAAFMLNANDAGLLRSLDRLDAAAASVGVDGGASIAAHADHVRYGLSLMNRWSAGENPFAGADWGESWRRTTVSEDEWREIRDGLAREAHRWIDTLRTPIEAGPLDLKGIIGSVAHIAYHLGAIRQIDRATRGPKEGG